MQKTQTLLFAACLLTILPLFTQTTSNIQQPTSINEDGSAPDASAILDIQSTNKAFLPPRMDFKSIQAIPNPVAGMMVYDNEFNCMRSYNGSRWQCLTCNNNNLFAPPGNFYGLQARGPNTDSGTDVATDAAGNIYMTGFFKAPLTFGTDTLTGIGSFDLFLVKYNCSGELLWVQQAGGPSSSDIGWGLATDSGGSVLVCGRFENTATFGTTTVTGAGMNDIFIAKYDSSGILQWVETGGGAQPDNAYHIGIDSGDNVYVIGDFESTATFGGITLTSEGEKDMFLAKYNSAGNIQWVQQGGGPERDGGVGIAIDVNDQVCIIGGFTDSAKFDMNMLVSVDTTDIFVAQYDSNGILNWIQSAGGKLWDVGTGIATDTSGNILVSGLFQDTTHFGATTVISSGDKDIFSCQI